MSELLTRISERTDTESKKFTAEFKEARWKIVEDTIKDKKSLIKWLYEEQGERRFDAANRLFLVLIDKENMEESWKMKRNIELLGDGLILISINLIQKIHQNWILSLIGWMGKNTIPFLTPSL